MAETEGNIFGKYRVGDKEELGVEVDGQTFHPIQIDDEGNLVIPTRSSIEALKVMANYPNLQDILTNSKARGIIVNLNRERAKRRGAG